MKKLLRFYFSAESLERAFDNLILKNACDYAENNMERICDLIWEKQELSRLWGYMDGVLGGFSQGDRLTLKGYADLRCGIQKLGDGERKSIKRAVMRFSRRARRLGEFKQALGLVDKYYCLIGGG